MPGAGLSCHDVAAAGAKARQSAAPCTAGPAGTLVLPCWPVQAYVTAHPGRYAATTGTRFTGPDDPLPAATTRGIDSIAAALRGYGIGDAEMVHAIRIIRCIIHGLAMLQASDGFRWSAEPGDTLDWVIRFIDRGLRADRPSTEMQRASLLRRHPQSGARAPR